jgi:hypothetical protein
VCATRHGCEGGAGKGRDYRERSGELIRCFLLTYL